MDPDHYLESENSFIDCVVLMNKMNSDQKNNQSWFIESSNWEWILFYQEHEQDDLIRMIDIFESNHKTTIL